MHNKGSYISLAEHNPELVLEWNYSKNEDITPDAISYGSAKKVWWICANGHEWISSPNTRTRGSGCPECAMAQRIITKRENIVAKRGSLADNNPCLASEWHPTKNHPLTPSDFTASSIEKVWWQCKEGHEWQAEIRSRNSGNGCPICSGHLIIPGINDLQTIRPELAAEWHPTKNGKLSPSDVSLHNGKKVWWQCKEGHEWQTVICCRTKGNGCPICSGHKILVGFNDLPTQNPRLVSEWNWDKNGTLRPENVTANSNKKVWWRCQKGHEWQAIVSKRNKGTGCPFCFGEAKTSFPEQALFFYLRQITTAYNRYVVDVKTEIDIYLPEHKIGVEYDGAYFHKGTRAEQRERRKNDKLNSLGVLLIRVKEIEECSSPHTFYSRPGATDAELTKTIEDVIAHISEIIQSKVDISIDVSRDRSQIYEQYVLSEKEKSLLAKAPEIAEEWHPTKNGRLIPAFVSVRSNKKVWWQCKEGHEWQAVINSRASGVGCPYCAGKRAIIGKNDLATVSTALSAQWHPSKNGALTPQKVTMKSNRRIWWVCEKGHEWQAIVSDRTNGRGCPFCSGKQVLEGFNDLATTNPQLAMEWHPSKNGKLKPTNITAGSDKKVWWKCENGHGWESVISSRNIGCGCPYCAGQRVIKGYNDLETLNPILAAEWHPTKNGTHTPADYMPGSNKKAWWLGKCGHEWEAIIYSRNAGSGCPYCASQRILVGFNDLATINPQLAMEWHPSKNGNLTPRDVTSRSNKKVWWMCAKGHEWMISINTRTRGNKCPYCSNQLVLRGYNDLETLNPILAAEWHPTKNGTHTPADYVPGSNKKAWWLGKCGHEWQAVIARRNEGVGCMACYQMRRKRKN
ncbi:MAG: zinc-ribbon domain-containing protein [Clostridia bacterium]|nr:zinc-ribbon domain-containing protein [Clostridia bacterium]